MPVSAHLPLFLMALVAPIGAFDVLYFHIWKFRLFARPASRCETATHVARGLLVGAVVLVFANFEPRGAWFWLVAAAVVLDFANNVVDAALEPASRASLGGLPRCEYVVHVAGATMGGAVGALFLALFFALSRLPTELAPARGLPAWLVLVADGIALGSIATALVEAALLLRASRGHAAAGVPA
jgi:hypothetical protein